MLFARRHQVAKFAARAFEGLQKQRRGRFYLPGSRDRDRHQEPGQRHLPAAQAQWGGRTRCPLPQWRLLLAAAAR